MESIQIDGSPLTSAPVHAEVLAAGLGKPADFAGKDFRGKLALVQRGGGVKFWQKAENAAKAGAVGTIVYNNEDGIYPGVLNGKQTIPIVMISKADGEKILDLLAHGAVTSDFRVEAGDYGYLSGTSMATPHVAGVVALMRSVNPTLTPARIREILQATAKPIPNDSGLNEYGAGLVNAEAAVQAAASVY
jgi:serine protease